MSYYLDLYNGNPSTTGTSVLRLITGSAARPDITDDLTDLPLQPGVVANLATLVVAEESESQTNISYVAIFDAASGGNLVVAAALGASPTIAKGNPVQFNALDLTIRVYTPAQTIELEANLSSSFTIAASLTAAGLLGQWDFSDARQSSEILTCGI